MRRTLAGLLLAGTALCSPGVAGAADPPPAPYEQYLAPPGECPADDPAGTPAERIGGMLCLIDYARAKAGVPAVAHSPLLAASSDAKAGDMDRCADFSHTACGRAQEATFADAGYTGPGYQTATAENLGSGPGPAGAPRAIMLAWLQSETHRNTIFDLRWRDEGVGLRDVAGPPPGTFWVAHFGVRTAVAPPPAAPSAAPAAGGPAPPPAGAGSASGTGAAPTPSAAHGRRLRVGIRHGRLRACRRAVITVRVRALRGARMQPVRRAQVTIGRRHERTDRRGFVHIAVRFDRPGRHRVSVRAGKRRVVRFVRAR